MSVLNHHSGLRCTYLRRQQTRLEGSGWSTNAYICNFLHNIDCSTDLWFCRLASYTWKTKTGYKSKDSTIHLVQIEVEVASWWQPKAILVPIEQSQCRIKQHWYLSAFGLQSRRNNRTLLLTEQEICNCVSHLLWLENLTNLPILPTYQ